MFLSDTQQFATNSLLLLIKVSPLFFPSYNHFKKFMFILLNMVEYKRLIIV